MIKQTEPQPFPASDVLAFRATNVTGTREMPLEVQRGLPAGDVAESIANLMALPDDVPWVLRDDRSSAFLDEDLPIGEQLAPGARVTITPRTHLGGAGSAA